MLEKLIQSNVTLYAMWGLGLIGLILQTVIALFLNTQVKASGNMVTTKKKIFKTMRQKNENNKALGLVTTDYDAFMDKYFYRMRVLGIPVYNTGQAMKTLRLAVLMVAAGGLVLSLQLEVEPFFREEMVLNGVIVAAFLAAVENIIPIKNKIGLMKANVRDYLLNSQIPKSLRGSGRVQDMRQTENAEPYQTETEERRKQPVSEPGSALETVIPDTAVSEAELDEARRKTAATVVSKMSDDEILTLFLRNYLRE